MKKDQVIALDGPSGSGKSTVAKKIAERLNLVYIDTGAMFRAVAYTLQHTEIDFSGQSLLVQDEEKIKEFFRKHRFQFAPVKGVLIQLDNLNLTDVIREHHISQLASKISRHKVVRDFLADWQREIVAGRAAILDGRDIGTVIFPNAKLKVYLTATPEERALRRQNDLKERGQELEFEVILKDIKERDEQDMTRLIAPLKKAEDAILIDSSGMEIDEVVEKIIRHWNERG